LSNNSHGRTYSSRHRRRRTTKPKDGGLLKIALIGAVIGGIVGYKVGDRDKLTSLAGAALGVVSIREIDRHHPK
jgi:uncharacterized protein YcfJ